MVEKAPPSPRSSGHPNPPAAQSNPQPDSREASPVEWMATGNEDITIDYNDQGDEESIWGEASRLSLASSLKHWRIENNRRYHTYRDGSYWAPHDEQSLKLDNYAHLLYLLTLKDKLFLAPLEEPERAIDIGTGIGIWAQNFADQFPNAEVIGTDLSQIQEEYPAPNLRFEVDDCCSEWVYPPNHFDYIHVRMLYGSVADWTAFYRECMDHLKPGGWLEHSEINPVTASDDDTRGDIFDEAGGLAEMSGQLSGKLLVVQPKIKDMVTEAGFQDVVEKKFKWPIGDWPADPRLKELGRINARHWIEGIEGWTMRLLTAYLDWTPDRVRQFCQNMRLAIQSRKHHVYQPVSVVYARKPLSS